MVTPVEYMTYEGSLTHPGCEEGATWIVMRDPLKMSTSQVKHLIRERLHELKKSLFSALKLSHSIHTGPKLELKKGPIVLM